MAKAKQTDDRIPFSQWQRHDAAADAYHRTKARSDDRGKHAKGGDTNIVTVKNDSGADRAAGEILEFTDWELDDDPEDQDLPMNWLVGDEPTLANGFGVLLREIPSGERDSCQVAGACRARVNVTDADHMFAKVVSGDYVLESVSAGPIRILYKPSGTGEATCFVLLGFAEIEFHRGVTDAAINKGASGTVSRYDPGTTTDSGTNDTVLNDYANVGSGKKVAYIKSGANYYMISAEC